MSDSVSTEAVKFSDAMDELERIVRLLEGGQLDLEDSLKQYERGVALIGLLQAKLSSAEQQVSQLLGQIQPVDGGDDSGAEDGE